MARTPVYFEQDGKVFYLYPSLHEAECANPCETVTAPIAVKDFDSVAASKAREWFVQVYCAENNLTPYSVFELQNSNAEGNQNENRSN